MFASDKSTRYLEHITHASYHNPHAQLRQHYPSFDLRTAPRKRMGVSAEPKLAYLKSLLALTVICDTSASFNRWRRYFLEHPELWPYLAAEPMIDSKQEQRRE